MSDSLFDTDYLDNFLAKIRSQVIEAVGIMPDEKILSHTDEEIATELAARGSIEMVELDRDGAELTQRGVQIDVSGDPLRDLGGRSGQYLVKGEQWTLHVPLRGDTRLFGFRPSQHLMTRFRGTVRDSELRIWFEFPEGRDIDVQAELLSQLGKIEQELTFTRTDVERFNDNLPREIAAAVARRRGEIARHTERLSKLTIPLRREPEPETRPARTVQRRPARPAGRATAPGSVPSARSRATLAHEYEHVLDVLRTYSRQMERAPASFAKTEEGRRDAMLGALATHYRGEAFAEAFNRRGKTDILIREDDHNLFICECKIWNGAKAFAEAIDQLLGYATWHDTRLSLVVFVEQRDLSRVVASAREALQAHDSFGGWRSSEETELRCELKFPGDDAQRLQLAVLFVHLVA